jgi:hypothetical protein
MMVEHLPMLDNMAYNISIDQQHFLWRKKNREAG